MTDVQIQSIDKVSIGNIPIRNGGVYVISGIFSGANACVCGKKMHSRPGCWPSKHAKRCEDKQPGDLARKL